MDKGAWRATVHTVPKSRTQVKTEESSKGVFSYINEAQVT